MSSSDVESGEIPGDDQEDELSIPDTDSRATLKQKLAKLAGGAQKPSAAASQQGPAAGVGYFDVYGSGAVAEVTIQNESIRLIEVQHLVTFVLADGVRPSWVLVKNRPLVRQVVLVAIPCLEWSLQRRCRHRMPFCEGTFGKPAVCRVATGTQAVGSALASLLTVELSKNKKREMNKESSKLSHGKPAPPPHPPSYYVLDLEGMRALKYPVPEVTDDGRLRPPAGFVWSADPPSAAEGAGEAQLLPTAEPASGNGHDKPQQAQGGQGNKRKEASVLDMPHLACGATMYGLDCEMCITANGFEVTRVSMVDHTGKCVMDELVVPDAPITDYNTQYSGITAEMLAGVKTRLPDIQRRLCTLVTESAIIVGHSLENDFNALRFVHGNCIDTAQLYPHPKGLPYRTALRVLADRYLHRKIQRGSHDSVQDAAAAMELVLLKIKNGPAFGLGEKDGEPLIAALGKAGRQCSLVDRTAIVRKFVAGNCHAHGVESDAEAVAAASREIQRGGRNRDRLANDFVFTRLLPLQTLFMNAVTELRAAAPATSTRADDASETQGSRKKQKTSHDGPPANNGPATSGEAPHAAVEQAMSEVDEHLRALWDCAAVNTLFIAVSLGGNTFHTRWLLENKLRRQQGLDGLPPWTSACEEHYNARCDEAIRGCCYAAVKSTQ